MADGEVFRKESKRWVAPQTSYDGDDWGTEYDEYDDYNEYADYVQNGAASPPRQVRPPEQKQSDLAPIGEEGPGPDSAVAATPAPGPPRATERQLSHKRKEVPSAPPHTALEEDAPPFRSVAPLSHSKSNSVSSTNGAVLTVDDSRAPAGAQPEPDQDPVYGAYGGDSASNRAVSHAEGHAESHTESNADGPDSLVSARANDHDIDGAEAAEGADEINEAEAAKAADAGDENAAQNEEPGGSIQDIYGFYESRYPQHPYSAMAAGHNNDEFSDSTASLSTGRRSLESGLQESIYGSTRGERLGSMDYQSDLNKVPEDHSESERQPGTPKRPSVTSESEAPDVPESPYVLQSVERLHITKSPGHSRNASLENDTPLRPLSHVDADIAEMYQGTSAFLDRPISTYTSQPLSSREISDASIRELLTPQAAQGEFESVNASSDQTAVPSLFVTEASPERARRTSEPRVAESQAAPVTAPKDFAKDLDYVDEAGASDGSGEASDEDMADEDEDEDEEEETHASGSHVGGTPAKDTYEKSSETAELTEPDVVPRPEKVEDEPFILPSERNRLQTSLSASSAQGDPESSESYVDTHMSPHSGMSRDSEFADALHSGTSRETEFTDALPGHARDESQASGASAGTGATDSVASDAMRDSDVNSTSNTTGATSASDGAETTFRAAEGVTEPTNKPSSHDEQPGPQSVAAKVKRPPPVDFSALLNNSGGSTESRCEQLRLLRSREAEYSSGLETWLSTTYTHVDKSSKVFADGVPSTTQPAASHETHATIAATAKMTSVVHSSASNTKEKLEKVGNKSRSFFAKVMR